MFKKSDDANGESLGRKMCKFRQTQFITRVGYGRVKCLIKMFIPKKKKTRVYYRNRVKNGRFFFLNSHLFISILYENSEQENLKIIMNFEFSYILLLLFHACYTLFPHSKYNEREIRKKISIVLYPVFLHTQNKTNSSSIILQHFE